MKVGVIGDTHFPFCHAEYLDFCYEVFSELCVDKIVHIGDIVDHYIISAHESDRRGLGSAVEMEMAKLELKKWYEKLSAWEVVVCRGNHDDRIERAAVRSNLPKGFFKSLEEIYEFPETWSLVDSIELDGVKYCHGYGSMDAYKRCMIEGKSIVQGHLHTKCGTQYFEREGGKIFGMQVGCGVDVNSIGMSYSKNNALKSVIGVGIVQTSEHKKSAFNLVM